MFGNLLGKLTNNNEHKITQIKPIIEKINSLESEIEKLSAEQIKQKTSDWQNRLRREGITKEERQQILDEILPEAYAVVRESAKRVMKQRHRDVQLMAGIVLHQGKIAEQKTGEGKTLTATLPLYLNSLTGRGVHLVTPNDYLSKHGAGWYGPLYEYLGLKVGVVIDRESYVYDSEYTDVDVVDEYSKHLKKSSRVDAYKTDVTYGTNSQFGFDYLRDNMAVDLNKIGQVNPIGEQGTHAFAIVDEVDSVLIDVARTPLIISQAQQESSKKYYEFAEIANNLVKKTDYDVDEKYKVVTLTELGISKVERRLGIKNLYENDFQTVNHVENAVKAKALYEKDKDYVVQNGKVTIVDQNTGRLLVGNRWSNGLHQAVEAKEGVAIEAESKTVATISYQNYFRLYEKLAGMTGTAATEAEEFFKMYSLDVVSIPTFKAVQRIDKTDLVYKTESAKYRATAQEIAERYKKGQPVLIGTTSVDKSQLLANFLKRLKIPHEILNAKQNEKEAEVISQAGKKGSVTVATNMAGRGVDIILGGDPFDKAAYEEIVGLGGLYVIGTERHDSRRIDNQLRGRSGRQGDPGESRFFLSLQDDLLRIFGGEKIEAVMGRLGVDENTPIEAGLISASIENAQKKVESMNFDSRRRVVEYDDVVNVQRETIYSLRRKILGTKIEDKEGFFTWLESKLTLDDTPQGGASEMQKTIESQRKKYGDEVWFEVEKRMSLETIDLFWTDHIDVMNDLREGVSLRSYGQSDPLVEYRRDGKVLFEKLLNEIWMTVADRLTKVEVNVVESRPIEQAVDTSKLDYQAGTLESGVGEEINEVKKENRMPIVKGEKVGRNDPCPCGSGLKFKNCHGKNV
jgi:preprotein translocase subunit SecA